MVNKCKGRVPVVHNKSQDQGMNYLDKLPKLDQRMVSTPGWVHILSKPSDCLSILSAVFQTENTQMTFKMSEYCFISSPRM